MRTQEEIVERIKKISEHDFFGFETSDLLCCLDFEHAKEFLKPEATEEKWKENIEPNDDALVKARAIDYMPFAWEKANDQRGLSAGRSLNHFSAWLWLLGATEEEVEKLREYDEYGKPHLRAICNSLGIDYKKYDIEEPTFGMKFSIKA